ncbi:MAG: CHASE3 domain-containing protein, partial [Verrucomicrobiota bacterium]
MTATKTPATTSMARLAGALVVGAGGMVLVGWALDISALKSILPGWVSVKPNTALAFVLTGIAVLFAACSSTGLSRLCGGVAGLIGLLTLSEYIFGWNPGFDQWLFHESAGTVGTSFPGRMAPDSALCFVLLAAGLETARAMRSRNWMLTGTIILSLVVANLAVAALLTCFTPAIGAFGWFGLTIMAVPTAIVFAVLGGALVLLVWPEIAAFWSLGKKITIAYVGSLILVIFTSLTANRSVLWLTETADRVSHCQQVLNSITDVMNQAARAQSHTRGYVITGDERYFQAEQVAVVRCREELVVLRQLISDPNQQVRSVQLEAQVNELIQWFSQVIAACRTGSAGTVRVDMVNHGEDLMDSLRALIAQMDVVEQRLFQQNQRNSSKVSRFTNLVVTTGTLISLIIFMSVLFGLNRTEKGRQQALETLMVSEIRYRRLFEAARDGVLILDVETGMVVDVNPYLIELLGVTREGFLGKKVWELGFFKDIVANESNFKELKQKKYIRYEDMALEGHDGKRHEVEFISNVYLEDHQNVIQCNIRDVSLRKEAEEVLRLYSEQLRVHNDELSRLNRDLMKVTADHQAARESLQKSSVELQDKNAELERFIYTTSHDLKSPVVTVRTFIGYLEQDMAAADAGRIAKDLDLIRAATNKMVLLLDNVLELSRIGRVVAPPVNVTFRDLVEETLEVVSGRIVEGSVAVTVADRELTLCGDRIRLGEIFQNLIENACKFMGDQKAPRIEIGIEGCNEETVFFVRDNGGGIDPRHQSKVFGLFEKLDPKAEGAGIGLALVKRIVES